MDMRTVDGTQRESATPRGAVRDDVSFPNEQLLLVNSDDRLLGYGSKQRLHAGDGLLHRAFSVFLFDEKQRLLLHRRSDSKPLWPGYWTNSCCSHPRRGEDLDNAVRRRLREELDVRPLDVECLYHFEYHARFGEVGSERELCHVFLASLAGEVAPNVHPGEISDWCWLTVEEVDARFARAPEELTPWFQLEWQALRGEYRAALEQFLQRSSSPMPRSAA
jgi:isopentenyl-diphosphate delta-isomerase